MLENKKGFVIGRDLLGIYLRYRVSRSAAALSYFLTLTVFPLIICVYSMLHRYIPDTVEFLTLLEGILPQTTMQTLSEYLNYIRAHSGTPMFIAGLAAILTSSSAAFRLLHGTFSEMQGKARFHGVFYVLLSFLFSVVFVVIMYFAAVVILSGEWLLSLLARFWPALDVSASWIWLRFVLLFAVLLLIIYGIYRLMAPKDGEKGLLVGALAAALCLVAVSVLFSTLIGVSTRYSLVYGSLASVIILMFWLYVCGTIIIMGNALNVVLRDLHSTAPPEVRGENRVEY